MRQGRIKLDIRFRKQHYVKRVVILIILLSNDLFRLFYILYIILYV